MPGWPFPSRTFAPIANRDIPAEQTGREIQLRPNMPGRRPVGPPDTNVADRRCGTLPRADISAGRWNRNPASPQGAVRSILEADRRRGADGHGTASGAQRNRSRCHAYAETKRVFRSKDTARFFALPLSADGLNYKVKGGFLGLIHILLLVNRAKNRRKNAAILSRITR